MAKTVADFLGYQVGDILTLSDLQTQEEFKKLSVDFTIREIRTYKEPNGVFTYIGYSIVTPNNQSLLVLVKTMGEAFEVYIFFQDTAAPIAEKSPLLCLLTEDQKDLVLRMESDIPNEGAEGTHHVTWDRQTVTHGVDYEDTGDIEGICTLGEYFTNDENGGNNFCLIDWKGDAAKGFIEIWYGCLIKNHEIKIISK